MPAALIFEYMVNGSLHSKLHDVRRLCSNNNDNCIDNGNYQDLEPTLTWNQRKSILKDACRGIAFLHSAKPPCIHQDVKS